MLSGHQRLAPPAGPVESSHQPWPPGVQVEIDAKVFAGYYAGNKQVKTLDQLAGTVGRGSDYVAGKDTGGKLS